LFSVGCEFSGENKIISTAEDKLASTVVENMKETIKKAKHQ
jgi:hypothetical protein